MSETFQNRTNNHHTLFHRRAWDAMETTSALRNHQALQVDIDVDSHNEIHRLLTCVPLLDYYNAGRVLSQLRRRPLNPYDPVHSIDLFMGHVTEALRHPRNTELDKDLGELVIRAMEIQRPIVAQGISRKKVIDLGQFARFKSIPVETAA